jgi:hypothetical protein
MGKNKDNANKRALGGFFDRAKDEPEEPVKPPKGHY